MQTTRGQNLLEYTILIGVVALVFMYMGTGIKRGLNSIIKVTADQIGDQQKADQSFNDTRSGYMLNSITSMQQSKSKQVTELGDGRTGTYSYNTAYNEYGDTVTNSWTNGGFTPNT